MALFLSVKQFSWCWQGLVDLGDLIPPLIVQKGATGLKITSNELSSMEHTCTSLPYGDGNKLGFTPALTLQWDVTQSLFCEHRVAGMGGQHSAGTQGSCFGVGVHGCLGQLFPQPRECGGKRRNWQWPLPVGVLCMDGGGLEANYNKPEHGWADICLLHLLGASGVSVSQCNTWLRVEAIRWEGQQDPSCIPLFPPPARGCSRPQLFKAAIIPGLGLVLHLITAEQIRSFIYRSRRKMGVKKKKPQALLIPR